MFLGRRYYLFLPFSRLCGGVTDLVLDYTASVDSAFSWCVKFVAPSALVDDTVIASIYENLNNP
jgi:hypothetical protein